MASSKKRVMKRSLSTYGASRPAKRPRARTSYDNRVIESPLVGLGQSCRTKLKTVFQYSAASDGAGLLTWYLKPSSCFDPLGSISAIQPNLFDTFKSVFVRYTVLNTYIRIKCVEPVNNPAASSASTSVVAYPSITPAALASYANAASQPGSKSVMVPASGDPMTISFKLDTKKVLGRWGPLDPNQNGAAVSADPTEQIYLHVFSQNMAAASKTIGFEITMIQDVWFDKRDNLVDA